MKKEKQKFLEIKDIPFIGTRKINEFYTSTDGLKPIAEDKLLFKSGHNNINLYTGNNRILLKSGTKDEERLIISWVDGSATFPEKTTGVFTENTRILKILYVLMNSNLYLYHTYMIASAWGIFYYDIRKDEEYFDFPINTMLFENDTLLQLADELINIHQKDFVDILKRNQILGEINKIIEEAYDLDTTETDLINHVLEVSRYEFQESKQQKYLRRTTEADLQQYANVYIDYFGQLFDGRLGEYFQVTYYMMPYFVAMRFEVVENKPQELIKRGVATNEKELFAILSNELTLTETTSAIFTQQVVTGFDKKTFYIIKPNQYKSWHRAIAHLDASSFDDAIIENEIAQGGVGNHE